MGEEKISKSTAASDGGAAPIRVILNVYDLTPLNSYTVWFGFGIFHSGIEVHGMEYGFGAHDYPISGVFEVEPRSCPGFVYRSSVTLGTTNMTHSEFRSFIESLASEYHGDTYHLISKNCNHFTDDMSRRLIGKGIPGWVNRLAHAGAFCSCLLPESLQATTIKQLPEYHNCTEEDGSISIASTTPRGAVDSEDDDQDKLLMSPPSGYAELAFVKETPRSKDLEIQKMHDDQQQL